MEYIVKKGDTLSAIAKYYKVSLNELVRANNILNPNLILIGLRLNIPELSLLGGGKKLDRGIEIFKLNELKSKYPNLKIIEDYPNSKFKYILVGDKVYLSRNSKDFWTDISDNINVKKNILTHLHSTGALKNYSREEKKLYNDLTNTNTYELDPPKIKFISDWFLPTISSNKPEPSNLKNQNQPESQSENPWYVIDNPKNDISYLWNNLVTKGFRDTMGYVLRGINRRLSMKDATDPISNLNIGEPIKVDSKYSIHPLSMTGDTINIVPNTAKYSSDIIDHPTYILPEYIRSQDYIYGYRNRGDYTPLTTEGAIITLLNPSYKYGSRELLSMKLTNGQPYKSFIGIDSEGRLKVGSYSDFNEGDILSPTFSNKIVSLTTDAEGNVIGGQEKKNAFAFYPGYTYLDDLGNEHTKSSGTAINILVKKTSEGPNMYGNVYGGRVLVKVGNELRLLSGSINDINKSFEDMKRRNHATYGTFYSLDNGTFAKGIRTYDLKITSNDLKRYDGSNTSGGNFFYIKSREIPYLSFKSDTIWTPNVRTEFDESYIKGHPLINEKLGIVLHHTGFMDDDLTRTTNYLTDPKKLSSAHVIIGYDGNRKVLATPDLVTFHAGYSAWNNRLNVNDFMLGIEFLGDTNKKDLTDKLIQSAIEYMEPLIRRYNISLENIVSHEQVRNLYNDYALKSGESPAPEKHDINEKNYKRIIDALLDKLYYTIDDD